MRVLELKNMSGGVSRRASPRSSLPVRRFSTGFTLIELLIVTVVIVTLMGIVFRLAGAGGNSRAKASTLARMQRLENAISGYYAAYGSYPPVPLQGRSRDIRTKVSSYGLQGPASQTRNVTYNEKDSDSLSQIEAACRAQPVAVLFPFYGYKHGNSKRESEDNDLQVALSQMLQSEYGKNAGSRYKSGFSPLTNIGGLNLNDSEWYKVQCFQFGLLSFLLPRYLFMLEGDTDLYDHTRGGNNARRIGQWAANNQLPCHLGSGRTFESWEEVQSILLRGSPSPGAVLISNITSQAACARWMPNLEGIISGGRVFYGVDTEDRDDPYLRVAENGPLVFAHGDWSENGGSDLYILNGMTVKDGWGRDFYYHSDPPYQSYRLWSAGPNGRTFPPWFDTSTLKSLSDRKLVATWTEDDLMHLAN